MSIGFAGMPPEVISGLIYSGPGSSSMVAAASAWNGLAAELANTAQGYSAVVLQLAGEEWLGPASAAMAAAVQPYVTWLATTAGQAEQSAAQAMSAAAAFETVFASVVPPPLIAANRATLAQAMQTNMFGINNGIIAQLEAQYAEFWAQNTGAMSSYAGSSASASKIALFTNAPQIANPSGTANQAAATAAASATPAASIQSQLQQLLQSLGSGSPTQIQSAVNALSANSPISEIWFLLTGQTVLPSNLGALVNGYAPFASFFYNTEGLPYFSVGMGNFGTQIAKSAGWLGGAAPAAAAAAKPPGLGGALGAAGSPVAAGLGNASHVGHLAVPSSWSGTTTPATVRPAVQAISEPITSGESGAGNVLGGMPIGGTGAARGAGTGPRYGFKPTIMARPMSAG
ncbi:PPE family protein [Mycobacterium sp.]|uniref:PPE family protein n=1 Tax=Mycobacterium sp. TaxID=1785 RepID=UPI002CB3E0E5|nr:PPE family protein [Mycobacterium sp.]HTQ21850.1 PPE family protein [Mycobacterium sp.]